MTYFTQDYLDFFLEFENNNNKEWFHDNKKRYETSVKKPILTFVEDLIQEMQKHDPEINPNPKKCINRINRDIRFSKDKTPYNTHVWAHIMKGTKEDPYLGIAFRFSGKASGIMSGYFQPSKERMMDIRTKISLNLEEFQSLKSNK